MSYQIISSIEQFKKLENEWKNLAEISDDSTFFSCFEYCYAWWESFQFNNNYKLWIICIYQNKSLVAIAPLMLVKEVGLFSSNITLKFLARADYHDFIMNRKIIQKPENIYKKIFSIIESYNMLWDKIHLTHINSKSELSHFLFKSKYNSNFKYLIENPIININKYSDFDDFNIKCIPSKAKQYANRLKNKINYSLKVTKEDLMEKFAEIHISEKNYFTSHGNKKRHSLFENKEKRNFMNRISKKGHVLSYLLVDDFDNIIIYNSGYVYKKVFFSVLTAFDPQYVNFGVGRVMYYEIFKENFSNPIWKTLDSGTGRYQWKFEWTSEFNLLYQLIIEKKKLSLKNILNKMKQNIKSLFIRR